MAPRNKKRRRTRASRKEEDEYEEEEEEEEEETSEEEYTQEGQENEAEPMDEEELPTNSNQNSAFLPYSSQTWSPLWMYRTPAELTMLTIRRSGSEGVDRSQIGIVMGLDSSIKSGNRRVSTHIVNVCKQYPHLVGQYQKMDGRSRSIRYFWKESSSDTQPFKALFEQFEMLTGCSPCPFTIGQVIKFPHNPGLNTLRISDVTMKRLNMIIRLVNEQGVIVTTHRLIKLIIAEEKSDGYTFEMDKRSMTKCLLALERENLLKVLETTIIEEEIPELITLICHKRITSCDDQEVIEAVKRTIDEFHQAGRLFPHNQLRMSCKKETSNDQSKQEENDIDLMNVEERMFTMGLTWQERLRLLRNAKLMESPIVKVNEKLMESTIVKMDDQRKQEQMEADSDDNGEEPLVDVEETMDETNETMTDRLNHGFDSSIDYGYQPKMIRLAFLHQFLFELVHERRIEDDKPHFYERFHPGRRWISWKWDKGELPVFVADECPMRFVPTLPIFANLERGWFMLHDLLTVMPLSLYVLIVKLKMKMPLLDEYLEDPIRRHTLISDIPVQLRQYLWKGRRAARQLEHHLLSLSAFGLIAVASNEEINNSLAVPEWQMFYVNRSGQLRDTSTSERGFSQVSGRMDSYPLYEYDFDSVKTVHLYWQHMYAIALSTDLTARKSNAVNEETNANEIQQRHRLFDFGRKFDRTQAIRRLNTPNEPMIQPFEPRDGSCGMDSVLHRRGNWQFNTEPWRFVSWAMDTWRRAETEHRFKVHSRVNRYWQSKTQSTGRLKKSSNRTVDLALKRDRQKTSQLLPHSLKKRLGQISHRPEKSRRKENQRIDQLNKKKMNKSKKRQMDDIDLISEQRKTGIRSRFSPRERDMLIIIRAVSFFLNPVYRFWLDPTRVRDLMHQYLPESRCKTVQQLMAAGIRDLVRPERVAFMQRIVQTLTGSQAMRRLRNQMANETSEQTIDKKTTFFVKAFAIAHRLLFSEAVRLPSINASEKQFERFLHEKRIIIGISNGNQSINHRLPIRSTQPVDIAHIRHCVLYNTLVAMMLNCEMSNAEWDLRPLLNAFATTDLSNLLERMHSDGLLTKTHSGETGRTRTTLSSYFRHFFNHKMSNAIFEDKNINDDVEDTIESAENGNLSAIGRLTRSFCHMKTRMNVSLPDDLLSAVDSSHDQATCSKQLRSLETHNLHLDRIIVRIEDEEGTLRNVMESDLPLPSLEKALESDLPSLEEAFIPLSTRINTEQLQLPFEDFLLNVSVEERQRLRWIYSVISTGRHVGLSLKDIKIQMNNMDDDDGRMENDLNQLRVNGQVIRVGVEEWRFVANSFAQPWLLQSDDEAVFYLSRPWLTTNGQIVAGTVRWMAEDILTVIIARPGIPMSRLIEQFGCVLQPCCLMELLEVLERCRCLRREWMTIGTVRILSPFDQLESETVSEVIWIPYPECLTRFAQLFGHIPVFSTSLQADARNEER